jgi:hypothetical protein
MDFNNFGKSFGDKMMSRMFKPVNDVVWDMASGNIGVIKNGSIFTLSGEGENAVVTENLFSDFGITIPAFAQNTPFESVKLGDLVYRQSGKPGWVVDISPNSLRLVNIDSSEGSLRRNKVVTMGMDQSGVMVLRNFFSLTGDGGKQGLGMLAPLLIAGSKNEGVSDIVQMMLMMNMANGDQNQQPVIPKPELELELFPEKATKAQMAEVNARNKLAVEKYQKEMEVWANQSKSTSNAGGMFGAGQQSSMLQMMIMSKLMKSSAGRVSNGNNIDAPISNNWFDQF